MRTLKPASAADEDRLCTIIHNYYLDGPVVEFLREHAPSSEQEGRMQTWLRKPYPWPELGEQFQALTVKFISRVYAKFGTPKDRAEEGEDWVQDGWKDAIEGLRNYKFWFESRFKTWLYSVMFNRFLRNLRDSGQHPDLRSLEEELDEEGLTLLDLLPCCKGDPEREFLRNELYRLVSDKIDRVCSRMRNPELKARIGKLRFLEEWKIKEIAEELGLKEDMVNSAIDRIRRGLQEPEPPDLQEYLSPD